MHQQVALIRRRAWCVDRPIISHTYNAARRSERDMLYALCWHVVDSLGRYIRRRGRRVSRIDVSHDDRHSNHRPSEASVARFFSSTNPTVRYLEVFRLFITTTRVQENKREDVHIVYIFLYNFRNRRTGYSRHLWMKNAKNGVTAKAYI